jgi:hypothetical protein
MGIAEIIAFIVKNWKAFAIGLLVLVLLALGYYFRSVLAQRDTAKAQIIQLEKDIGLEKERAKQLEKAQSIIAADAEKYKGALTNIQGRNDSLNKKYTELYSKYSEYVDDAEMEPETSLNNKILEEMKNTQPTVKEGATTTLRVRKSIVNNLVIIPSGIASFSNYSTLYSTTKIIAEENK